MAMENIYNAGEQAAMILVTLGCARQSVTIGLSFEEQNMMWHMLFSDVLGHLRYLRTFKDADSDDPAVASVKRKIALKCNLMGRLWHEEIEG